MSVHVEVPFVNERSAEALYRRASEKQKGRDYAFMQRGMRAARARDPKLLKTLEKAAELVVAMHERQRGQEVRSTSTARAYRVDATEVQVLREAYNTLDRGTPEEAFAWVYGAAAELAFGG